MSLWKQIEFKGTPEAPFYLEPSDECYYARECVSRGGFQASESNQLMANFKKPMNREGQPDWHYKLRAARKFANELYELLGDEKWTLAAIPTSKVLTDPEYDKRMEFLFFYLQKLTANLTVTAPITLIRNLVPSHQGGLRNPEDIATHLRYHPGSIPKGTTDLILIDNQITTGGHFKACKTLINQHLPDLNVIGVFWARTVWTEQAFEALFAGD